MKTERINIIKHIVNEANTIQDSEEVIASFVHKLLDAAFDAGMDSVYIMDVLGSKIEKESLETV